MEGLDHADLVALIFKQNNVQSMVVALFITIPVSWLVNDMSNAIITPLAEAIGEKVFDAKPMDIQEVSFGTFLHVKFRIQYFLVSIIRLLLFISFAYSLSKLAY